MTEKDLLRMLTDAYELGHAHGRSAGEAAMAVQLRTAAWVSFKVKRLEEYKELVTL